MLILLLAVYMLHVLYLILIHSNRLKRCLSIFAYEQRKDFYYSTKRKTNEIIQSQFSFYYTYYEIDRFQWNARMKRGKSSFRPVST